MRRIFTLLSLVLAMAMITVACGEAKDTGFSAAPETEDAGHGGEDGGGGGPEFDPSPEPQEGPAAELTIQAQKIAFNRSEMLFVADSPITLTFENLDTNILHNVAIYVDDSTAEELFKGEEFNGADSRGYQIPATPAGEYYFQCDVHPNMNGTATFS
ncbi:MAG TPA: hypothetical protein VGB52_08830 [Actinomycetota bacterium]|jgi:plastocyanin